MRSPAHVPANHRRQPGACKRVGLGGQPVSLRFESPGPSGAAWVHNRAVSAAALQTSTPSKPTGLRLIELPYSDQNLTSLRGVELRSSLASDVTYQLEQALGAGSMAIAFRAIRRAPDGQTF